MILKVFSFCVLHKIYYLSIYSVCLGIGLSETVDRAVLKVKVRSFYLKSWI